MQDALNFHLAGQLLQQGLSPYGRDFAYPIVVAYFLALLSWLPTLPFCLLFLVTNFTLVVALTGRKAPLWIAYAPLLSVALYGNWELMLLFLSRHLQDNKRSAFYAALITLKPQVAVILLPPHLWRWRRQKTFGWFVFFTGLLWLGPLLVYPTWIQEWVGALRLAPSGQMAGSPSLFSLGVVGILLALGVVVLLWRSRHWSKAAALLLLPTGAPYNSVLLTGQSLLLIPVSWIPFLLTHNLYGLAWLVPLTLVIVEWTKRFVLDFSGHREYNSLREVD